MLPFFFDKKVYSLSHLNSFRVTYIQPATKDKQEKKYHCIIEFSTHCFTKDPHKNTSDNTKYSDELIYKTEKENRIFCFERYNLSFRLPNILKNEMTKNKCYFTSANDKFLSIDVIEDEKKINYEIYFSLKKSSLKECDVHIFINSAYIRSDNKTIPRRKNISFFVLLNNTITNKKIKKPL